MIQYDAVTLNTELDYFLYPTCQMVITAQYWFLALCTNNNKYFPEYSVYGYLSAEELWDDL